MRKFLIVAAALWLAWLAGQDAALAYWRSAQDSPLPAPVPGLFADDAGVVLRASERFKGQPRELAAQAQALNAAARTMLRASPLDVLAMRQLGVLAERASPGAGRDYIALAERISRRDSVTEFFSIDYAAARADVPAALRHFDHAMLVYPAAKAQLLPILASQLSDPAVRQTMLAYAGRPWLDDFAVNAIAYDVMPAALMAFYREGAGKLPAAQVQDGTVRVLQWLVDNRQYAALAGFAAELPGLPADAFGAIGLNPVTTDRRFAPLSWALVSGPALVVQANGASLDVEIEPEASAIAATRMTLLAPGTYTFAYTVAPGQSALAARIDWQVACAEDARRRLFADESTGSGARRTLRLTVPVSGCAAQNWAMEATAAPGSTPSSARISDLSLSRL